MTVRLPGEFLRTSRGLTLTDTASVAWTFDPATHSISAVASGSGGGGGTLELDGGTPTSDLGDGSIDGGTP